MCHLRRIFAPVLGAFCALFGQAMSAQDSNFGTLSDDGGALIGILYDLKQNQKGEKSGVNVKNYSRVVEEFIASGWDEAVLNRYFRVARPVYTTQVFIPMISAKQAPEAFGVAEVVEPRMWAVHYKGQAVVPMDGEYRLAGYSDDVMAARINDKTILIGKHSATRFRRFEWEPSRGKGMKIGNGRMQFGHWVSLKEGEVIDLDILVGERPGGWFCAYLFIQRKGEEYPMLKSEPVLPILQLAEPEEDVPLPPKEKNKVSEPRESSVWRAVR